MYEFLIKQDSGLYKPKSVSDLVFIEDYYSFKESQSNADAMLGEQLPFKYDGTNVSFVDESSLPDSGTYFPFAQIDCFNNSVMVAASNTVAGAKTDLLNAINTYGVKLVRVIHISTTVPFQPLPSGGGVTPADLALKQDKQLTSTSVYIDGTVQTTVEGALEATSQAFFKMPTKASVYIATSNDQADHYYLLADWSSSQTSLTKTYSLSGYIGNYESGDVSQFDSTLFLVNDQVTNKQTIQGYYDKALADGCDILVTSDQKIYIKLNGAKKYIQIYTSIPASKIEDTTTSSSTEPSNVVSTLSANCVNLSAGGGGRRMTMIDTNSTISADPISVDTNGGNT